MRPAYLLLALSAYLVLLLTCPFYDPTGLHPALRLLFLVNGAALLIGVTGFLNSFSRPAQEAQE